MSRTLNVYTDASVRGHRLTTGKRARCGPAFAAWAGWHGCTAPRCPTFTGQAYLGAWYGTQRAEIAAVIEGLAAALRYSRTVSRPDEVYFHVDNRCVFRVMMGLDRPDVLAPWADVADCRERELRDLGIEVEYRHVSGDDPMHRVVHSMSRQAPEQVLLKPEWRPSDGSGRLAA
jgi:ribonuclease HI